MVTSTPPQCCTIKLALSCVSLLYLVLFRKLDNELHNQITSNACLNKQRASASAHQQVCKKRAEIGARIEQDLRFFLCCQSEFVALAVPNPLQECFRRLDSPRTVEGAALLLQAYITSGKVWREHSQAAHTHVNPDVGLGGACGWLLSQEEQIMGEELQL